MEKILRRTILNRNQLVNKNRRQTEKDLRKAWRQYNRMKQAQSIETDRIVKNERIARREDWMLGPLAPKRDAGEHRDTFGAVENLLVQGAKLPRRELRGPRGQGFDAMGSEDKRLPGFEDGEWRGVGLEGNLVEGDRVAVVKGTMGVGRIGEVIRVEKTSAQVFVKNVNKVEMIVPAQAAPTSGGQKTFQQELPFSLSDVKLIATLPDSTTGALRDVIVRQVYGGPPYEQRSEGSNLPRHTRYIMSSDGDFSTDTVIPWPKEDPVQAYTQTGDTTRDLVEEVTYYPSIGEDVPLAAGVIDELRSKHSRAKRDWDDLGLMRKKMLEDARRDWFKQRSEMLSQPFWTKEWMAKEKERLAAAGREKYVASEKAKEVLSD